MSNLHKFTNSSSIEHCDYHEDGTMEIKFATGAVYHYPNCKKEDYEALKAASSPGTHFHMHLRKLQSKKVSG